MLFVKSIDQKYNNNKSIKWHPSIIVSMQEVPVSMITNKYILHKPVNGSEMDEIEQNSYAFSILIKGVYHSNYQTNFNSP